MQDIAKTRLAVLKEIKNIRKFFDSMETGVKSRNPEKIYRAFCFISNMVYHMNEGDLTPVSVELKKELLLDEEELLRDSSGVEHEVHILDAAGSIPAPATTSETTLNRKSTGL